MIFDNKCCDDKCMTRLRRSENRPPPRHNKLFSSEAVTVTLIKLSDSVCSWICVEWSCVCGFSSAKSNYAVNSSKRLSKITTLCCTLSCLFISFSATDETTLKLKTKWTL